MSHVSVNTVWSVKATDLKKEVLLPTGYTEINGAILSLIKQFDCYKEKIYNKKL